MTRGNSVHFFATAQDLRPVIAAVEADWSLQYVSCGLFDSPSARRWTSALSIPHFGIVGHGGEDRFLIIREQARVSMREVPQRDGGTRYAVDQLINPQSVMLSAGGLFGDSALIAGKVSTVWKDEVSQELLKVFAREMRRRFRRIKAYLVGAEAESLLDKGCRLTIGVTASPSFDLSKR